MKNNQYLEKYGEKALELYNKKSLKQNSNAENNHSSSEEDLHNENKITLKQYEKPQKSGSQKSLSRNSKSKSKISINPNQNNYTFQKPLNLNQLQLQIQDRDNKNRKKVLLSGLSTPKNNRSARLAVVQNQQKAQSSSTKKKPVQTKIAQKLNDALYKNKSAKLMVKQLMQCLDMVSQHQTKISKWINQFKQIVLQIAEEATHFRKKYKEQSMKNKKLQKESQQFESTLKGNNEKKRKPLQLNIMEQNQRLRQRIDKLERQIENYQKKEMILIQTLQKIKTSKPLHFEAKSTTKKDENHLANRIKREFYGNLHEEDDDCDQSGNLSSQQHLDNL